MSNAPTPFIPDRVRPLRREEYDKLIELGAFQNEKIELLEGWLVKMSPIGPPHHSAVTSLSEILLPPLLGRATVRVQGPFAALDLSEPEPDLAIVPREYYDTAHPDKAYLIIEVAESSLSIDRGVKLRLYARCGVPEYWIVNVPEKKIEVYTEPGTETYGKVERYERGQSVRLTHFPDIEVRVSDVMR
jgi:Uma2 family endonuclease